MAQEFSVVQQTVVDKASGLILKFWVDRDGNSRLSIWSEHLPLNNRDLGFEPHRGGVAFSGTALTGQCEMDAAG